MVQLLFMLGVGLMVLTSFGLFMDRFIPWANAQWFEFVLYCHHWSSHAFPGNLVAGFYNVLLLRTGEVGSALLMPHWWKVAGVVICLVVLTAWLVTKGIRYAGWICLFALVAPALFSSAWHFAPSLYQDAFAKISPNAFKRETVAHAQAELESWMRCATPDATIADTLMALEKTGAITLIQSPLDKYAAIIFGTQWKVVGLKLWGMDVHHIEYHVFASLPRKTTELKITLGAVGDDTTKLASQMNITGYKVDGDLSKEEDGRTWRLSAPTSKTEKANANNKKSEPLKAPVMSCARTISLND